MNGWVSSPRGSEPVATGSSEQGVATSYRMPVRLEANWQVAETRGVPGVRVTLRTELVLSAVEVRMSLRTPGSAPGAASVDVTRRISLFPLGTRVTRHERRVLPLAGGSRQSIRVIDHDGQPLTDECAIGPGDVMRQADLSFSTPVEVFAWVAPGPGPRPGTRHLAVRGELTFARGLSLEVSSRPGSPASPRGRTTPARIQLVGPGTTLHAREHTLEEGCPAEAWVFAGFVDEWGHELSDRCLLGRYVLP